MKASNFVYNDKNQPSPWEKLVNQIYLGSDQFIESMLRKIDPEELLDDIPKPKKLSPPNLLYFYQHRYKDKKKLWLKLIKVAITHLIRMVNFFVGKSTVSRALRHLNV